MTKLDSVYIAGPMRGIKEWNFPLFFYVQKCLEDTEYWPIVINPAQHDVEMGIQWEGTTGNEDLPGFNLADALAWDLDQILHGSAIVLLPGWETSSGARAELAAAVCMHQEVYTWDEDTEEIMRVSDETARSWIGAKPSIHVPPTEEVRVTDPVTGGQKGKKPAQLGAIDPLALLTVATVAGFGADKYARFNYLKGYNWSLSFDALQRHALAFWNGEDNDPESGLPHMAHAAWHGLALVSFLKRGLGTDDRYKEEGD